MIHVRTSGIHHKSASRFFSSKDAEEDVTRECTRQREWQKYYFILLPFCIVTPCHITHLMNGTRAL